MYVCTFYSFKGGVGRTMALANVAVQLAQTGRRVLLVDFDLEAPGLDTISLLRRKRSTPGIVEYVAEYLRTNKSPDVREYTYELPKARTSAGGLWVMPSGRGDREYAATLQTLDWEHLYSQRDGYLMFEDLKAQWKARFEPHYVFIDSRTGHTDVGGICTRHLPDAVVLMFFPNDQNLRGLREVVRGIRSEAHSERRKDIALHFVMSNVPDLDDEDSILERRMEQFKAGLQYDRLTQTIHRYDSLALLNQVIFTKDRPRSRLAREYRHLTDLIVEQNLEDREGALHYLRGLSHDETTTQRTLEGMVTRLGELRKLHAKDPEVLTQVAYVRRKQGEYEESVSLLNQVVALKRVTADVLVSRAEAKRYLSDSAGATSDVLDALRRVPLSEQVLRRAIRLLRLVDEHALASPLVGRAIGALEPVHRLHVIEPLQWSVSGMTTARSVLQEVLKDKWTHNKREGIVIDLSLSLIAEGNFAEAIRVLKREKQATKGASRFPLPHAFNLAMAVWGMRRKPSIEAFREVAGRIPSERSDANGLQCQALTSWVIGDTTQAFKLLAQAREEVIDEGEPAFSCWRYLMATRKEFIKDLEAMHRLFSGESDLPLFISRSVSSRK